MTARSSILAYWLTGQIGRATILRFQEESNIGHWIAMLYSITSSKFYKAVLKDDDEIAYFTVCWKTRASLSQAPVARSLGCLSLSSGVPEQKLVCVYLRHTHTEPRCLLFVQRQRPYFWGWLYLLLKYLVSSARLSRTADTSDRISSSFYW